MSFAAALAVLLLAAPAGAQYCAATGPVNLGFDPLSGSISKDANCSCTNNCTTGFRCYPPVLGGASYELRPAGCNPKIQSCTVRATLEVDFPGNSQGLLTPGSGAYLDWSSISSPVGSCGYPGGNEIFVDKGSAWIEVGGFTCSAGANAAGSYSLLAQVCVAGCPQPPSQRQSSTAVDLSVTQLNALFCKKPPVHGCPEDGPAGTCCLGPGGAGGGGGSSPAGGGPGFGGPGTGPDTFLYYLAGGVGNPSWPGTSLWTSTLGRYWSHTYAERIVLDPDETHVWLITRHGTFREFSGFSGGVYGTAKPTDEHRRLTRTATGWQLKGLDGTIETFDASGRWTQTLDRDGNAQLADYSSGPLTRVTLLDGRREDFSYAASGKLSEIRQIGVDGVTQRSWLYTWTGDDLTRITRPDGTALEFHYDDARFPGYLTRVDLVSTDLIHRVAAAWELDSSGNVARTWKGDPSATGPNAVEIYTFSYTNPALPSQSRVTDPLGQTTTYSISRDSGSSKPKITQIQGDCPVCGTGPNSVLSYGDSANPLMPTQITDGRGLITQLAYNANGLTTSKTEAAGTALARTTTYQYGTSFFAAFVTRIDAPSTSGGSATRSTILSYNTTGDLITRTVQGAESGGSFSYVTASTFNAAGRPLTVDPPGYGTADVTTATYDPTRGNLLPLTRTDPLVGATTFGYDPFNRRTSVTDPNGVQTVTAWDNLDRVTSVTQKGATPAEDLVTTYSYNTFGDLFRTILPRGNLIEYGYDAAGRLISIERRPDASTHGDRTFYTLDTYGHRTKEELQSWNGSAWVSASFTSYVYSSRCHLDKAVYPDGSVTEYAYDCDNNLSQVLDANHPKATNPTATQTYAYDGLNRLASLTQPWGGAGGGTTVTTYGYDVQDHLNKVTDAEGNVTTYTYGDRDLMTIQVSPASGTTTYAYNEHGELTSQIDARGIAMSRTVDALGRPTAVTYPTPDLNVSYTYDDPAVSFSKGRLTRIARGTSTVDYRYDRFGRLTQDGELSYAYDANGNPALLVYPGGVTAVTTYDFADRPASLLAQRAGKPDQPLVSSASYLPYGPLNALTLGNGLTETHTFTQRYFPSAITLGSLLSWTYTTDKVGNVAAITDSLSAANNRTYGYQDDQYFLTQGNGPWGTRAWTYDRIGNRLTETRSGTTDTYTYELVPPPGTGHSPILSSVALGAGGTRTYQYDPAGNLQQITQDTAATAFTNDDASQLAALAATSPAKGVSFRYDGRDYLTLADSSALPFLDSFETGDLCAWSAALGVPAPLTCAPLPAVHPTYSSEGLLHALQRATAPQRSYVFHFAGRPIAQMDLTGTTEAWKLLTVDHLGTPMAATGTSGTILWQGGFEPFGADWSGAGGAGVFLRLPGQWGDEVWTELRGLHYNVYRWYEVASGRYTKPDALLLTESPGLYAYAFGNPNRYIDVLGLQAQPSLTPPQSPPLIPYPRAVPPPCNVPVTPPALSPALATIGGWATVVFTFLFDPPDAGGEGDTRYEPVPRSCKKCGGKDDDEDDRGPCAIQLERCLENPWQPQWNRRLYGPRKNCGDCYAECKKHGGLWPVYKCPF
jgi:RHS repeat-associated protein